MGRIMHDVADRPVVSTAPVSEIKRVTSDMRMSSERSER